MAISEAPAAEPVSILGRAVIGCVLLAALALGVVPAAKWLGPSIAAGGHSQDATPRRVAIGSETFALPANTIRNERARVDGAAQKVDLYLRWPDMAGYTAATREDFNNAPGAAPILFLSIEPKTMSRDMSGRLEPIYRVLTLPKGRVVADGLTAYAFDPKAGYDNEELFVLERGGTPLVARCLTGQAAAASIAPCQRDVAVGKELSLVYRFPASLLGDWQRLEEAVTGWVAARRL